MRHELFDARSENYVLILLFFLVIIWYEWAVVQWKHSIYSRSLREQYSTDEQYGGRERWGGEQC